MPKSKRAGHYAAEVDAYINKRAEFAQPILAHLREVVHEAVPEVEETIKWSMPFFVYKNIIVANMAGFKAHCSFGMWGRETASALRAEGLATGGAMGSLGRITSLDDLPAKPKLLAHLRQSAKQIDTGQRTSSLDRGTLHTLGQTKHDDTAPRHVAKPLAQVPAELAAELKRNQAAAKTFAAFAPSCKREYIDWVASAKREQTRTSRAAQAAAWMAEGRKRNWKYESC